MTERLSTPAPSFSGLPGYMLSPGFEDTIVTDSGAELHCKVGTDSIAVFDKQQLSPKGMPYFFFEAQTEDCLPLDGSRVMEVCIRVEHSEAVPSRHPDLHPDKLVSGAIDYFDAQVPLTNFKAVWSGRNPRMAAEYNRYNQALANGETAEAAAFATFTGRMALRNGFTRIHRLVPERKSFVVVNFGRPLADPSA